MRGPPRLATGVRAMQELMSQINVKPGIVSAAFWGESHSLGPSVGDR